MNRQFTANPLPGYSPPPPRPRPGKEPKKLKDCLHLIEDDLQSYPGEALWFSWLDWDVFDHWRFVWEPLGSVLEPVNASG